MSKAVVKLLTFALLAVVCPTLGSAAEIRVPCEDPAPNRYMVVLKEGSFSPDGRSLDARPSLSQLAQGMAALHGGKVGFQYRNAAPGFSVEIDAHGAQRFAHDPRVELVEQVCPIYLSSIQFSAPWGLDRVDQSFLPLNTTYTYQENGSGVNVYIIDTGITPSSTEFGTRLKAGVNFVPGIPATDTTDCYGSSGHGTAVASVVGGSTYGVAKGVNLYPLRIFNCSVPTSWTDYARAAVDWLITNHVSPAVANMSWETSPNSTLEASIQNAINIGIVMVAAAGNSDLDACSGTPSRMADVITVGATDTSDRRATFPWSYPNRSNYGSCVDLWAPGRDIPVITKTGASGTFSGTSFAAPHTAGAAALFLQTNPSYSPATVASYLTGQATSGVLSDLGTGSPNLLLFAKPAHACVTWSCNASTRTCSFDMSCSRMPFDMGYYSLDFGDGTNYYGGSATVSHTYPANDIYAFSLTLVPWYAQSSSTNACVNVSFLGTSGCYGSGATPWM